MESIYIDIYIYGIHWNPSLSFPHLLQWPPPDFPVVLRASGKHSTGTEDERESSKQNVQHQRGTTRKSMKKLLLAKFSYL